MADHNGRMMEFFEGDDGRLSMTRLMMFLAFFPACYVIYKKPDEETLSWLLTSYVLGYAGGRIGASIKGISIKAKDADSIGSDSDGGDSDSVYSSSSNRIVQKQTASKTVHRAPKRR